MMNGDIFLHKKEHRRWVQCSSIILGCELTLHRAVGWIYCNMFSYKLNSIKCKLQEYICYFVLDSEFELQYNMDKEVKGLTLKIKEHRERYGWNQAQLADKAGISKSSMSDIENGKRSPQVDTLQKIARALDVPIQDLIEDDAK